MDQRLSTAPAATVSKPGQPRPVTPLGIVVEQLAVLLRQSELEADLRPEDFDEWLPKALRRTHELAAGLDSYVEQHTTPESAALRELAEQTAAHDWTQHAGIAGLAAPEQEMLSGHVEGQLLKMLVHLSRARRVLEIGMFTGYSCLAIAEALPECGRIIACEIDAQIAEAARQRFRKSPAGQRIDIRVGPARETLASLAADHEEFDLIFIDADKAGYLEYLNVILDAGLITANGVVCVDNTLMQGQPWAEVERTANGVAIAEFNEAVTQDPRLEQVLLPLRDGLTLIRRIDQA